MLHFEAVVIKLRRMYDTGALLNIVQTLALIRFCDSGNREHAIRSRRLRDEK